MAKLVGNPGSAKGLEYQEILGNFHKLLEDIVQIVLMMLGTEPFH